MSNEYRRNGRPQRFSNLDDAVPTKKPAKTSTSTYGKCAECGHDIPNPWYSKSGLCDECTKTLRSRADANKAAGATQSQD